MVTGCFVYGLPQSSKQRTLKNGDADDWYGYECDQDWGCGDGVYADLSDLVDFQVIFEVFGGLEYVLTIDEVTEFTSEEVLGYHDYGDVWTYRGVEFEAIDSATGLRTGMIPQQERYWVSVDFPDGNSLWEILDGERTSENDRVPE